MRQDWAERVPDLRQLAAVRRITLDDGAERGVRALSFDTGGGLAFWLLADRSLDIGPLSFRGMPLAWQHPAGFVAPGLHDAQADGGTGIQRALSGFLVTCGLDNVRQPRDGLPLHGTLPLTPARVTACGEDWDRPDPLLFAEGVVTTAHMGGACFRLHRRIEAPVGGAALTLIDRVENIGPERAEMRVLYHTNFGFPMVAEDTTLHLDGAEVQAEDRDRPTGLRRLARRRRADRKRSAVLSDLARCPAAPQRSGARALQLRPRGRRHQRTGHLAGPRRELADPAALHLFIRQSGGMTWHMFG